MLYLAGDNDLSYAMEEAIERLESAVIPANVQVLVLFDGYMTNYSSKFLVQPGGEYTLGVNKWFLGETNTGDPKTLSDFVTWGRENYPADYYYVSIASHGRGTSGLAEDETNGEDPLTPAELYHAFDVATDSGQWKIDVLHYDACLMNLLENAFEVQDFARYWISLQNLG